MERTIITKKEKDDLLAQIELAFLIEQRSPTRFGKAAGNSEKRTVKGPCPFCGGTDRFAVFVNDIPQHYKCGIHGNGCGKHGDAIQFLVEYAHLSFEDAISALKGEPVTMHRQKHAGYQTVSLTWDNEQWQERAAHFCQEAADRLWRDEGAQVLAYLKTRGLTEDTIKKAHLGMVMHKGSNIARNEHGAVPCLVIPWYDSKQRKYWRVNMRDIRPGIDPKRRYENIPGSSVNTGLYLADSLAVKRPALFMVEGEIDALSIAQEAGDLVAVVATGSTKGSQASAWVMRLSNIPQVFVAFDTEPNAEESAAFWTSALTNARRWCTPIGKDANEMLQRGLNIRVWVESAISLLTVHTDPGNTGNGWEHAIQAITEPVPAKMVLSYGNPPLICHKCWETRADRFQVNVLRQRWACLNCGDFSRLIFPVLVPEEVRSNG